LLALDKVSEVSVVGRTNGETGDVVAVFVVLGAVEGSVSMVVDEVRIWARVRIWCRITAFRASSFMKCQKQEASWPHLQVKAYPKTAKWEDMEVQAQRDGRRDVE
jgi:hypothetical protein